MLLEMAVRNSLEKAAELNLKSIALPAISSGIFRFPKTLCAEIMFQVAMAFAKERESSVKEIRFTNFDKETVDIFVNELRKHEKK